MTVAVFQIRSIEMSSLFQQRPGQSDEVSWGTSRGKGIPGRGNSSMKTLRPSFVIASSVGREERSTFSEHLPSPGDVIV